MLAADDVLHELVEEYLESGMRIRPEALGGQIDNQDEGGTRNDPEAGISMDANQEVETILLGKWRFEGGTLSCELMVAGWSAT
jgi:hypothetical protein